MKKNKICLIFSTRPEIIKLAPIAKILKKNKKNFFFVNTGQHFDFNMSQIFYNQFKLQKPKYKFNKNKNCSNIFFISKCMNFIEKILIKENPTHVIIQGDTDTTLIGALTAYLFNRNLKKNKKIKIIHVEAGLRSFDESMPEEINRKIVDIVSDILLVPTFFEKKNLLKENLHKTKKIKITGNTIAESIDIIGKNIHKSKNIKKFFLLTIHRAETVDNKRKFLELIKNLNEISKKFKINVVFPIHPRTKKNLSKQLIDSLKNISFIKPLGYLDFIRLLNSCKIVLTDSGGIQEEAYILNKPCITLRNNTERQVTTFNKSNIITGCDKARIVKAINFIIKKKIKIRIKKFLVTDM